MPGDYYLLDPHAGWRALDADVVLGDPQGMHLRALPGDLVTRIARQGAQSAHGFSTAFGVPPSAFSLQPSAAFSITGLATDGIRYSYLADAAGQLIWRFDQCDASCAPLPCVGGLGSAARRLDRPRGLALAPTGELYVADSGNRRVQVFDTHSLALRAILAGPFDEPYDVAVGSNGDVYIADKGAGRVYRRPGHARRYAAIDGTLLLARYFLVQYGREQGSWYVYLPARARLERWPQGNSAAAEVIELAEAADPHTDSVRLAILRQLDALGATDILHEWLAAYPPELEHDEPFVAPSQLAIDPHGRLYVADTARAAVTILDADGRVLGQLAPPAGSGGFQPAGVAVGGDGLVLVADCVNARLHQFAVGSTADGRPPAADCRLPTAYVGASPLPAGTGPVLASDPQGNLLAVVDGSLAHFRASAGFARSGGYHSQALDSAIEGCQWHRVVLACTLPADTAISVWTHTAELPLEADELHDLPEAAWQTGQTFTGDVPGAQASTVEALVQSPPGRYLWLRLRFTGTGAASPLLRAIEAAFPRVSSLQYLPAVYQHDPISRDLLDRFLSIFDSMFERIEHQVDSFGRYLDPDGVPDAFLNWLAGWLALSFEGRWTSAQKRELLRRAPELFRRRGTLAGLKEYLRILTGCEPHILEHFTLRRWQVLGAHQALGGQAQIMSNRIVQRLQLGENSRIGDFRLISTGDPGRDALQIHAHTFSVFLPANCLDGADQERAVRRLIEQEKPAHTQAFLQRIEPRLRVGVQATVGIDTIVGRYPRLVLPATQPADTPLAGAPASGATLGFDTLLAPAAPLPARAVRVAHTQVGVNTIVG